MDHRDSSGVSAPDRSTAATPWASSMVFRQALPRGKCRWSCFVRLSINGLVRVRSRLRDRCHFHRLLAAGREHFFCDVHNVGRQRASPLSFRSLYVPGLVIAGDGTVECLWSSEMRSAPMTHWGLCRCDLPARVSGGRVFTGSAWRTLLSRQRWRHLSRASGFRSERCEPDVAYSRPAWLRGGKDARDCKSNRPSDHGSRRAAGKPRRGRGTRRASTIVAAVSS